MCQRLLTHSQKYQKFNTVTYILYCKWECVKEIISVSVFGPMRKHYYIFSFLQEIRIRTQIIHVHVGLKSNSKEEGHGRVRLREVWLWVDRTTRSLTLQWAGQRGVYCTLGGHWASHRGWTVKPFYVVFFVRIFCLLQFLVHLMSKHLLTKMTKNTLTYSPWNPGLGFRSFPFGTLRSFPF